MEIFLSTNQRDMSKVPIFECLLLFATAATLPQRSGRRRTRLPAGEREPQSVWEAIGS